MSQSQSTAVQDQNNLQPGDKKVSEWKRFLLMGFTYRNASFNLCLRFCCLVWSDAILGSSRTVTFISAVTLSGEGDILTAFYARGQGLIHMFKRLFLLNK